MWVCNETRNVYLETCVEYLSWASSDNLHPHHSAGQASFCWATNIYQLRAKHSRHPPPPRLGRDINMIHGTNLPWIRIWTLHFPWPAQSSLLKDFNRIYNNQATYVVVAAVFNPHVVCQIDEHLDRGGSTDTNIVTTLLCTLGCVTRPGLCDDTMCYQSWRDISTSESSSASQSVLSLTSIVNSAGTGRKIHEAWRLWGTSS